MNQFPTLQGHLRDAYFNPPFGVYRNNTPSLELCFKAFHLFLLGAAGCSWKILCSLGLWYHEKKIRKGLKRYIGTSAKHSHDIYTSATLCVTGMIQSCCLALHLVTQAAPACSAHGPPAMLVPPVPFGSTGPQPHDLLMFAEVGGKCWQQKTVENTIRLMNDTCWYVASPSYSDSYTAARHRLTNQCTSTRLSLLVAVLNSSSLVPQNHLGLWMYEAANNFTLTSKQPPSFFSDFSFWTWLNFTNKPKLKTTQYTLHHIISLYHYIMEVWGVLASTWHPGSIPWLSWHSACDCSKSSSFERQDALRCVLPYQQDFGI